MKALWTVLSIITLVTRSAFALAPSDGPRPDEPHTNTLAHYRFDGNPKDEKPWNPDFQLKNTEFRDNALYLNGIYGIGKTPNEFRAVCLTPNLDYNQFTVALRFKAEDFNAKMVNIFSGGTACRWFGMFRSKSGNLTITLNNANFSHEIKTARLTPGKWTVVACGVDVQNRKVSVFFDGKKADAFDLPHGFKLDVIGSRFEKGDKVWSFSNYSNGTTFHGLVDECIIYGEMLSDAELGRIPLEP